MASFADAGAMIWKTIMVKGDIHSAEPLTIEGRVEGTIEIGSNLLTVAPGGDVKAHVTARNVEVHGSVEGEIQAADTVYIRAGAEVVGDIYAATLIVEEGGYIKGNIDLTRKPEDSIVILADAATHEQEALGQPAEATLHLLALDTSSEEARLY